MKILSIGLTCVLCFVVNIPFEKHTMNYNKWNTNLVTSGATCGCCCVFVAVLMSKDDWTIAIEDTHTKTTAKTTPTPFLRYKIIFTLSANDLCMCVTWMALLLFYHFLWYLRWTVYIFWFFSLLSFLLNLEAKLAFGTTYTYSCSYSQLHHFVVIRKTIQSLSDY